MNTSAVNSNKQDKSWISFLVAAAMITLFLFYIDEGYYSFRWMSSVGGWVIFGFYFIAILISELLIYELLLKNRNLRRPVTLSILLGAIAGVGALVLFFSLK